MALNLPYHYDPRTNPPIEIVEGIPATPVILINKLPAYDFATNTPGAAQLMMSIVKANIRKVSYVYNPVPGTPYPYATVSNLVIEMIDDDKVTFALQTVSNVAYNTGTEADCQAAVAAINASL